MPTRRRSLFAACLFCTRIYNIVLYQCVQHCSNTCRALSTGTPNLFYTKRKEKKKKALCPHLPMARLLQTVTTSLASRCSTCGIVTPSFHTGFAVPVWRNFVAKRPTCFHMHEKNHLNQHTQRSVSLWSAR